MSTPARGYAALSAKAPLAPFKFERRSPRAGDVVIEIKYCGICHSDIHQARDEWGGSRFPMVPGHEIAGVVTAVGSGVTRFRVGDHVGVGCMVDSCLECDNCRQHLEQYCLRGFTGTYNGLERDGSGAVTMGGYSSSIVVREEFVLKIPSNLPLDASAPLLCAGITLYSPLAHWRVGPGKRVAIVGLGGLGHMGVKIAHAMGADVTVLSHSMKKADDARRLGADHFYATSDASTFEKLRGQFDVIVNTVSSVVDWNALMGLLRTDGALVVVGIPDAQVPVSAFSMIRGRISLAGSLIGGIKETQEMLDFCGRHGITSDIELIAIQDVNKAYERVTRSDVRYRFVIDMKSLEA